MYALIINKLVLHMRQIRFTPTTRSPFTMVLTMSSDIRCMFHIRISNSVETRLSYIAEKSAKREQDTTQSSCIPILQEANFTFTKSEVSISKK